MRLFKLGHAGEVQAARPLYRALTPAFHLDTSVKLVQYIRQAEHIVYGAPPHVRSPRLPLSGDELATVEAIVRQTAGQISHLGDGRPTNSPVTPAPPTRT